MYHDNDVIDYLQSNNILALKLDRAFTGVENAVSSQFETIGAGAKRAIYYTACFTREYQDVCQQQKSEDLRFATSIFHLLKNGHVVYDMLRLYFDEIFKYKTSDQIEHVKKMLMAVNIHIAASSLTNAGFAFAVASAVALGVNLSLNMSSLVGSKAGGMAGIAGLYGVVQKAADSAQRLHYASPAYYAALYNQELEMLYFFVEPLFERSGAFRQSNSEGNIAEIITRMIR